MDENRLARPQNTKRIWMYWHQGFAHANRLVHECVESWRSQNPDWEVVLLDKTSISTYIGSLDLPEQTQKLLRVQHRSDLIRTKLLIQYGGVWADPTCFCSKPLDAWLKDSLSAGVFFFSKPGRDRVIANWFIAVDAPDNPLLIKLYAALCSYWRNNNFRNHYHRYPFIENNLQRLINRRPEATKLWLTFFFTKILKLYPYMIYHYMFYKLVTTDKECNRIWDAMPKRSAQEPPILQRLGLLEPLNPKAKQIIEKGQIPLFKLKWNLDISLIKDGTILHHLFKFQR